MELGDTSVADITVVIACLFEGNATGADLSQDWEVGLLE